MSDAVTEQRFKLVGVEGVGGLQVLHLTCNTVRRAFFVFFTAAKLFPWL